MSNDIYVQVKPVGSFCNLKCDYCYVERFKTRSMTTMDDAVLERVIIDCIASSQNPTITWHGGEPTLAGLAFFEKAARYAKKYRDNKTLRNVLQTNATTITPALSKFFADQQYEIGVSIDGPLLIHGVHRKTWGGENSFGKVVEGLDLLRRFGNNPFVIATVTKETLPYATEVFDFLVGLGFKVIKYSPVYDDLSKDFSISSRAWFRYLEKVFGRWVELENPEISVRELDEVISWLEGKSINFCSSTRSCLNWVSVDPKGDIYPCEYLRSEFSYGNIMSMRLSDIPGSRQHCRFRGLFDTVPAKCQNCDFLGICGNGCPATRVLRNGKVDSGGVYVYCEERRRLFRLIKKAFDVTV